MLTHSDVVCCQPCSPRFCSPLSQPPPLPLRYATPKMPPKQPSKPAAAMDKRAGAKPTQADAASSSSSQSDPRDSPASALYADVLHSLFRFLPLRDLAHAAAVCKWWRSCVDSMPGGDAPAAMSFDSLSIPVIRGMVSSPLARRITSLTVGAPLSLGAFHALSAMSSLVEMDVWMGGSEENGKSAPREKYALLPPAVTSLNLRFGDGLLEPRMIAAAGESKSLVHLGLLLVPYTNFWYPDLDLSPLCRSSTITALQLDPSPSDDQVNALKPMASLHRFLVPRDFWFVSKLWQGLKMDLHHFESKSEGVNGHILESLATHAPNLTQLPSGYFFQDALAGLARLKKLRILRMQPGTPAQHRGDIERNTRFDAREVMDVLAPCAFLPRLELLSLERLDGLTCAHLSTLSGQLSSLLILQLSALKIDGLSFLAPLCRLRQLHLISATDALPVSELSHALSLPALERMHIAHSPWERDEVMRIVGPVLLRMRCFAFGEEVCALCPRDPNPLHDLNPDECQMTVPTTDYPREW